MLECTKIKKNERRAKMEIRDKYLSVDNVNDGDIITFIDAGYVETGKFGNRYNFRVNRGSYEQIWTPDSMAMKELVRLFSRETDNWVNKRVSLIIIPNSNYKVGKSVIPKIIDIKV